MCGTLAAVAVGGLLGLGAKQADSQRKAMNRQADATIAAAEQSAKDQLQAMMASAQASADAAANMARMEQARSAAAEAAKQEVDAPEVLLQAPPTETAREGARRRRATFGVGVTNTGVQL